MFSPACASIRPTAFRATVIGSTKPDISRRTAFTSAFCSTCSIRRGRWTLGAQMSRPRLCTRRDPGGLSGCSPGVRASRSARCPSVGRAADRDLKASVHPQHRQGRDRPSGQRPLAGGNGTDDRRDAEQEFAEPIFHVHYLDLVKNPVGTVAALYRHFGDTPNRRRRRPGSAGWSRQSQRRLRAHGSRLEEYGLDAALERERYARYMAHFGIQPEPQRRWRPQRGSASPVLASRRSVKPVK